MSEGTIQAFIGREIKSIQQAVGRSASRSDITAAIDRVLVSTPTRREVDQLRLIVEDVRAELRQQRIALHQTAVTAENIKNQVQTIAQRMH
jgi:hypothetical protein